MQLAYTIMLYLATDFVALKQFQVDILAIYLQLVQICTAMEHGLIQMVSKLAKVDKHSLPQVSTETSESLQNQSQEFCLGLLFDRP